MDWRNELRPACKFRPSSESDFLHFEHYKKAKLSFICMKSLSGFNSQISARNAFSLMRSVGPMIAPNPISTSFNEIIYEYVGGEHPHSFQKVIDCIKSLDAIHSLSLRKIKYVTFPYFKDIAIDFIAKIPHCLVVELGVTQNLCRIVHDLEYGVLSKRLTFLHGDPNLRNCISGKKSTLFVDWNTVCLGSPVIDIGFLVWDTGVSLSPLIAKKVYKWSITYLQYDEYELIAALRMIADLQHIIHVGAHRGVQQFSQYSTKVNMSLNRVQQLYEYLYRNVIDEG